MAIIFGTDGVGTWNGRTGPDTGLGLGGDDFQSIKDCETRLVGGDGFDVLQLNPEAICTLGSNTSPIVVVGGGSLSGREVELLFALRPEHVKTVDPSVEDIRQADFRTGVGMAVIGNAQASDIRDVSKAGALDNVFFFGVGGDDRPEGERGTDLRAGGEGADLLTGGVGADLVVYRPGDAGSDTIVDFNRVEGDRIDIEADLGGIAIAGIGTGRVWFVLDGAAISIQAGNGLYWQLTHFV